MPDADLTPTSATPPSNPENPALEPTTPTDELPDASTENEEFETEEFETEVIEFDDDEEEVGEVERVSKLIAKAGLASRRAAEEMITEGRVAVNGHVIREQGIKADPLNDKILVDGFPLRISSKPNVVILLHKPRLVMTTRDDPGGRSTVYDFLTRKWANVHPVGRLDFDTSGVLLLTDDGELTHLLTHPSHGAEKVYEARVRGTVTHETVEKLERGIKLDDGPTAPCRVKVLAQRDKNALLQITLREGRNRQVRRMLEAVGHPVNSLRRVSFAGIELEGLEAGEFRVLLGGEAKALRKRVESKVKKKSPARPRKPAKPRETTPAAKKIVIRNPIVKSRYVSSAPSNSPRSSSSPTRPLKPRTSSPGFAKKTGEPPARPTNPRAGAPRPETPRASAPRPGAPRPNAPRTATPRPANPRPAAPQDRSSLAKRIEKKWKS